MDFFVTKCNECPCFVLYGKPKLKTPDGRCNITGRLVAREDGSRPGPPWCPLQKDNVVTIFKTGFTALVKKKDIDE